MKKIRLILCVFIITFLFLFNSNISYASNFGRVISFDNNKILVYQQLDSMRIKSSKGHVLAGLDTRTYIGSIETEQISNGDVDVCFILDFSGSMIEPVGHSSDQSLYTLQKQIEQEAQEAATTEIIHTFGDSQEIIGKYLPKYKQKYIEEIMLEYGYTSKSRALKNGMITLIDQIKEKFGDRARIGVLFYSTKPIKGIKLIECTEENISIIHEEIMNQYTNGSTGTAQAIKAANDLIWEENNARECPKYTFLITDGMPDPNDEPYVNQTIKMVKDKTEGSFITLFINGKENELKGHEESFENSDETMAINEADIEKILNEDIFETITSSHVKTDTLVTEIIYAYNAKMWDNNTFSAEIDDELLNGGMLELEYSFNIITTEEIDEVTIIDHLINKDSEGNLNSLGYNENARMISIEKINNQYGWVKKGDNLTSTFEPEMEKDENGNYKNIVVKLLLQKPIATGVEVEDINNPADMIIKTKNKTFLTKDAIESETIEEGFDVERNEDGEVIKIAGKILPPLISIQEPRGETNQLKIICSIAVIIMLVIVIYSKKHRRKI
ncbi:MAG: VWA domain-containing protein [Clostridia bacterium]|nr:VWA domain-containing protein [Clostridia bacterium]